MLFEGKTTCSNCGREIQKFIVYTLKEGEVHLCNRCAHHMARVLLEDLIAYYSNERVSLTPIMGHWPPTKGNSKNRNERGFLPVWIRKIRRLGVERTIVIPRNITVNLNDEYVVLTVIDGKLVVLTLGQAVELGLLGESDAGGRS